MMPVDRWGAYRTFGTDHRYRFEGNYPTREAAEKAAKEWRGTLTKTHHVRIVKERSGSQKGRYFIWAAPVSHYPYGKKTRRRKNPVRPGELFVIVDVSSPGGTWDGQIYRGSAKADREAAKRKGQRVQVIDAMWYTPARNVLETSGLIARTRKNPSAEDRYLVQEYMAEQADDVYYPWDDPSTYRTREEANRDIRRLIRGTPTRTLSTVLNRLKRTKGMSPDQHRRASKELRYLRQVYGENIEGMQAIKMIEKELASRRAKGTRKNPRKKDYSEVNRAIKRANRVARAYNKLLADSFVRYGDGTGVAVSGVIREHFPNSVKNRLREQMRSFNAAQDDVERAFRAVHPRSSLNRSRLGKPFVAKMIKAAHYGVGKQVATKRPRRTRKNPRVNTKKGYMKVNARISHWMGDLYLEPVSQKACTAYSKHMEEMTGHYGCTAYIQNSWEVDSFIAEYVPPSKRRDLHEGWDATFLMDPWIFGHMLGYDAHHVSW
jgi:hypothetical protein